MVLEATCPECDSTEQFPASEIEEIGELVSYQGDGEWVAFSQCPNCGNVGTLRLLTDVVRVRKV